MPQGARRFSQASNGRLPQQWIVACGILVSVAFALAGCAPDSQTTSRSSGAPAGTTLQLSLTDHIGVQIGGELLGSFESGFDGLVGDLVETGSGSWRGVVTGTAERKIQVSILGTMCDTSLKGTQQLEAVATRGTYADGRNLRLVLTPLKAPQYTTFPSCNAPEVMEEAPNGIEWLWFYFDAYRGVGIEVKLPDKPGGTWTWELAPNPNPGYPGGCGSLDVLRCEHRTELKVSYR